MELTTHDLILRIVSQEDIAEISHMWNFWDGGVSTGKAREVLAYMASNHAKNRNGALYHLCLAVCKKEDPGKIWGWCGLDGRMRPEMPEIFVLLHESVRNRGYGTQCVKALLRYAFSDAGIAKVHGGCDKENIASARMMLKGGMRPYGNEENGDPLFIAEATIRG